MRVGKASWAISSMILRPADFLNILNNRTDDPEVRAEFLDHGTVRHGVVEIS